MRVSLSNHSAALEIPLSKLIRDMERFALGELSDKDKPE
jgi:hypothetical protein